MINRKGGESKTEEPSFLAPLLVPSQSIGRRSLSTLELECLSFTHQTICFIRFIFSPSDPAQPDNALMMKRRGHPCIVCVCVCVCVSVCMDLYIYVHVFVSFILVTLSFWPMTLLDTKGNRVSFVRKNDK